MGISLGLVGLGNFGKSFADLFMSHPLVDRIALCDREAERIKPFAEKRAWQKKFNERDAYDSLDAICDSDLDALVVITQPWLHAPQCVQALEAGKHVYSAVPIIQVPDGGEILDWCDKLVETCRRTGLHYMMGETTYYRAEAMYCRRRAAEGAFGDFVYAEGEYMHDFGHGLAEVLESRFTGAAGREGRELWADYRQRGVRTGPMHYPTHSTAGPICVMGAHAVKVSAWGSAHRTDDPIFQEEGAAFSNETGLFRMSNGSTMRICEYREIGCRGRESFRIYGTQGCFENRTWHDKQEATPVAVDEMRDPLPEAVAGAFRAAGGLEKYLGGHGGSHAYLVHEFVSAVAEDRHPAINAWEAVRYMAPGVTAHQSALTGGELLDVPDWGDAPA